MRSYHRTSCRWSIDPQEIADETRKVSEALEKLRPEQKQILEMALVEGHSQQEISNKTGMPLGTLVASAARHANCTRADDPQAATQERSTVNTVLRRAKHDDLCS